MKSKGFLKYTLCGALAFAGAGLFTFSKSDDFGLGRNMEVLVNMMRELSVGYVDEVDPDKLMEDAAAGMVSRLDPYTEYIPESGMSNFELLTTGKYGGMGALIRKKDNWVAIAQPYRNSPSDRAGLKIGDVILEIDGKSAENFTTEKVSSLLKGVPGSKIKIKVMHLDSVVEQKTIIRERISIPSVPYYGFVDDSIAYLRHSDFIDGSYEEIRSALVNLREQGMKGLILDYRTNGGGIMEEAVKILSLFLPRETEVLSTKGRTESSKRTYKTSGDPLFPDLNLVVLVSGSTASASEIVSGALQDLDRAVLLGQRSFGKGLVQSTRPLAYNNMLKLTTAKYYIPSGRCIQAIDYSHSQEGDIKAVSDSLISEFKTRNGRKIYDGGGIMPDIVTQPEYISRFAATLYALGFITDFGDEYMRRHPDLKFDLHTFGITDADYADFKAFMKDKKVPYESDTRRALKMLKKAAQDDRFVEWQERFEKLEAELKDDTQANIDTYRKEIEEAINNDIVLRYAYLDGTIEYALPHDKEVLKAAELLRDTARHARILREQDTVKK